MKFHKRDKHAHVNAHTYIKIVPALCFLIAIIISPIQGMRRKKHLCAFTFRRTNINLLFFFFLNIW